MKAQTHARVIVLKILLLLVALLIVPLVSTGADIYRYTDEAGVTRFTDDPLEVPQAQRPDAKRYPHKERPAILDETPSEDESQNEESQKDESQEDESQKEAEKTEPDEITKLEFEYLDKQKKELEAEYAAITEERDELTQNKERMDVKDYNDAVDRLNKRIQVYDEKWKALQEMVDAYNAQKKQ